MLKTFIFIVILLVLYYIIKSKKRTHQTFITMNAKASNIRNNFLPIKIIDNDNELEKIVSDFARRKEEAIKDLTVRLGKAFPNDVIWSILQRLYSEFFLADHKIFLNTVYQQGLLLQKEKKYKQAISHYAYGLYYLMSFYKTPLKPTAHLIDFVTNETQLIEMAQHKFINKIQLCMEYGNFDIEEVKEAALFLTNISPLPNINPQYFIMKIQSYLHIKEKYNNQGSQNQTFQNLGFSSNNKLFEGLEFNATLQFRTPLEVLIHHGKIYRGNGEPPKYAKEIWQGTWSPKIKEKYDLKIDTGVATDIGSLTSEEANLYLNFLIKFHTISEGKLSVEEKIIKIKELEKNDFNFKKYYKKKSGGDKDFLESHFHLLIANILSPKITKSLNDAGFRRLQDLKGVDAKALLQLDGVGKATIDKIAAYL